MKAIWCAFLAVVAATLLIRFAQVTQAQVQCDPAHPDVCIAPAPPDLDCGDIEYRNFRVQPPDPHHFDGDADSIGCEVEK